MVCYNQKQAPAQPLPAAAKQTKKEAMTMTRRNWKRWVSLLLAAVLLTALLTSCSGGSAQTEDLPGTSSASGYEAEVIRLVNDIRTQQGLPELTTSSNLSKAAALRAEEIVTLYSHTRPDHSSCFTVLPTFGVSFRTAGENIAAGQPTPSAVVNAWMNSPGHRANILNPEFKSLGVGYVSGQGSYGHYWVQLFIG